MLKRMLRRAFMWATIASLAASGFAGIAALLIPHMRYTDEVLGSTATVGAYSLLATICAIVIERARKPGLRALGAAAIALSILAAAIILTEIWADRFLNRLITEHRAFRITATATTLAVTAAHFGLYFPARLLGAARWLKLATVIAATTFGTLLAILFWIEPDEEWVLRSMGALGILTVMGSAITPIVWKMQSLHRRDHATPTLRADIPIHIRCPRCALEQSIPLGKGKCARCKLEIRIEIEEPRCPCGYQFLGLKAEKCPECGRTIPEADRWALLPATPPNSP